MVASSRVFLLPALVFVLAAPVPVWAGEGDESEEGEEDAARAAGETVEVVDERPPDWVEPATTSAAVDVVAVDERLPSNADVADVVGAVAGTHVQRLGGLGDYSVVTIRGSSARQVEVFVDGVPLNPHGSSTVNLAELPLDAFERVEIYRSGAPFELGSSAMGGVVNLVTAAGQVPAPRLEVTAGSLWTGRMAGSLGVAPRHDRIPMDLVLHGQAFATEGGFSYFDDGGTPYNLTDDRTRTRINADITDVDGRLRFRAGDRKLRLVVQDDLFSRDQGVPGLGHDQASATRFGVFRNGLLVELAGQAHPVVRLRGRVTHRYRGERYQDPYGEMGVGRQDSRDRHQALGGQLTLSWIPLAWQAIAVAAEVHVDGYEPRDLTRENPSDGVRNRVSALLALGDDFSFADDAVRISPAVRLHLLDNRLLGNVPYNGAAVAADAQPSYAVFAPRLGLLVRPWPVLAFKANGERGFRPPDFMELFGDRGAMVGNPELIPESSWAWDVGLRFDIPANPVIAGGLSAGYFWRHTYDAIIYVQNSQRTQVPVNFGEARVGGIEGAIDATLGNAVDLRGAATWMFSRNLDTRVAYTDNQLPRVPRWEVSASASVHWGERLRVGYDLNFTSGNYWDATNWYLAAPRTLHGLFVRSKPGPRWPSFEVEVRNLLDERVEVVPRDPLNPDDGALVVQPLTDFTGYPLPGRVVLVTVSGEFGP